MFNFFKNLSKKRRMKKLINDPELGDIFKNYYSVQNNMKKLR